MLLEVLRRAGFSAAEASAEVQQKTRHFLAGLPPATYPHLVEAAGPLSTLDNPEGYYRFGLDLLLAGIGAMAARSG